MNENTELARQVQLERVLPRLAATYGPGHKMLYVGGHLRYGRNLQILPFFKSLGVVVDIIEIFPANILQLKTYPGIRNLICDDIRNFASPEPYDIVCWWHGPEHVTREDFAYTMAKIEQYCTGLVICATPNGRYDQGPEYGNQAERHLAHYTLEDWLAMGWTADAIGIPNQKQGNIIAWKQIGQ